MAWNLTKSLVALCAASTLMICTSLLLAAETIQDIAEVPTDPESTTTFVIDPADLESFIDGIIIARMKSHDVAGVTVSLVHNGEMIFAKGYGYDDVSADRKVEAARSLFRPGSISKTFTWTSAMQLYEQGKLDLEADVSTYLNEVDIPETFSTPITMLHLMAQAPGFEDSAVGHLFTDDPDAVLPLVEYLKTHQPTRVRPPGVLPAYSNYGTALAGHIVANISGMPFEDYVDQNIFEPLGMHNSSFRESWGSQRSESPIPERLQANLSKGYIYKAGGFEAGPQEYIGQIGPAGALSTTATDMAKWMLMHLNEGSYNGVQILQPETARLMHQQHFTLDPRLNGMAHGFIESRIHGYRVYGHGGGTVHFLSDMQMIPELGLGIFISTNTTGGGSQLINGFVKLLVGRYFENKAMPRPEPPGDFAARGAQFEGTYIGTRRSYTSVERVMNNPLFSVATTKDGYLLLTTPGSVSRWVEIAPYTFQAEDSDNVLKFVTDDSGSVTSIYLPVPIMVMEKVGPLGNPNVLYIVLVLGVVVFMCALFGAWLRRKQDIDQTPRERLASQVTLTTCAVWLVCYILAIAPMNELGSNIMSVFYAFPQPLLVAAFTVAILGAVLSIVSGLLLYPVWTQSSWPLWRRLRHTGVVVCILATAWVLNDLNAIGYHYF